MLSPKPQDFPLLLEVFRDGLARGLISKDKVVAWADDIIKNTDEPDYFFIELSLAGNVNRLIEVIDPYVANDKALLSARVLLGRIYKRLIDDNDALNVEDAAKLVGTLQSFYQLTFFERDKIYTFDEYYIYYLPDVTQLQVELIDFLSIYEDLTLENSAQWPQINIKVEELLKQKAAEEFIVNESFRKAWEKKKRKQKVRHYLTRGFAVLGFVAFIGIIGISTDSAESFPILYWCSAYIIIRAGYEYWKKRRQQK